MSRHRPIFSAILLVSAAACAAPAPGDELPAGEARAALQSVCGGRRWVGRAATCPVVPGWTVEPLFGAGAPAPLDAYYACTWTGTGPSDLVALAGARLDSLGEDCPVVVPQGEAYEEELASSLRASFQAQVGTVDGVGLSPAAGTTPVRVVVVDSAPDAPLEGPVPVGADRHGDTLAGVIGDIACGSSDCAAQVSSALAMPWLDDTTASPGGGHVGRPSDLARAVWRAFEAGEGREERLVLNLSLGWEHAPGLAECSDDPAALTAPARAVHDVLQHVACQGALVIAAAGNDAGGPHPPQGMMCPARWEARALGASCDRLLGAPMVHAVGGVDYAGRPIVVTRPGGRPRLAATALGGVGWASTAPVPPPLTGTSVAAAVASGVSAVVWARRPDLTSAQVIAALYGGGEPAGPADVCPAGEKQGCTARRVSLCGALERAGVEGLPCAAAQDLPTGSPPLAPAAQLALSSSLGAAALLSAPAAPVADLSQLPRWAAPSPALSGGVFPQPVVPVCPSCTFGASAGTAVLYARLTVPVTQPTLVLETGTGVVAAPLSGSSSLAAGAYTINVGVAPATVTRAWVTGTSSSGTVALTQEILVSP